MKLHAFAPVSLLALLMASAAPAADDAAAQTYVLAKKGYLPPAGMTLSQRAVSDLPEAALTIKVEMQKIPGSITHKVTANEVREGLAPGKVRRTLTSMTTEHRMLVNGSEEVMPDAGDPLQGVPVIVEVKDGNWTAELEKGEPDDKQEKAMVKLIDEIRADNEFTMYGDTPRKAGDKWDVDLKALNEFGGMKDLAGTFNVELVEVKDGRASLKATLDLSGKSTETAEDGAGLKKMTLKGEALIQRSLADMVDLESKFTCKMTGDGDAGQPGVTIGLEGKVTMESTVAVEKK